MLTAEPSRDRGQGEKYYVTFPESIFSRTVMIKHERSPDAAENSRSTNEGGKVNLTEKLALHIPYLVMEADIESSLGLRNYSIF